MSKPKCAYISIDPGWKNMGVCSFDADKKLIEPFLVDLADYSPEKDGLKYTKREHIAIALKEWMKDNEEWFGTSENECEVHYLIERQTHRSKLSIIQDIFMFHFGPDRVSLINPRQKNYLFRGRQYETYRERKELITKVFHETLFQRERKIVYLEEEDMKYDDVADSYLQFIAFFDLI